MDLAFFQPQTSRYLDITATGSWTIRVRSVTTTPSFDSSTAGQGSRRDHSRWQLVDRPVDAASFRVRLRRKRQSISASSSAP